LRQFLRFLCKFGGDTGHRIPIYEPNVVFHAEPVWTESLCDIHSKPRTKPGLEINFGLVSDLLRSKVLRN
jgi:hypothetical protein